MARGNLPIVYAPGGLVLNLPETLRATRNAVSGQNFDITPSGDLVKRKGHAMKANDELGYGLTIYEDRTEILTSAIGFGLFEFGVDPFGSPTSVGFGNISEKLVGFAQTPKIWANGTLSITYSGAGVASCSINATSESDIKLVLVEDGTTVLTSDLGDGTEGSPVTIAALETAIDAITDFSATVTGTSTVPAAFLDFRSTQTLSSTAHDVGFGYWSSMNSPTSTPMSEWYDRRGENDFENPTATSMNGVLYMVNGYDEMLKYDGQNLYRAGIPRANLPSISLDAATSVNAGFSGTYSYKVTYRQIDEKGNQLQGAISAKSRDLDNNPSGGPFAIKVKVNNLIASTGYNTDCAIVQGAQTSTNVGTNLEMLTVDDGASGAHTLKVGDRGYFYDNDLKDYVIKKVNAVTTNTVTFESDVDLTVSDNAVISNNLRVQIWRTEANGTLYSLVEELPNDAFNSITTYSDTTVDARLKAEYTDPTNTPSDPPKCKYIQVWRNQLVLAGDPTQPTTVYYSEFSDVTNPENFPVTNEFQISPGLGDGQITGMVVLAEDLIIFTKNSIFSATGNLATDDITINVVSDNIGCVAAATIQELDNRVFFLSAQGVYELAPNQFRQYGLTKISEPLDPLFRFGANNDFRDSHKRATAAIWPSAQKYLLYTPVASLDSGDWYESGSAECYVYDIQRKDWYKWLGVNALGGMVTWDDKAEDAEESVWFCSRELDGGSVVKNLCRFNYTNSEIDYSDHVNSIDMRYQPQWEFSDSPRAHKMYTEMTLDAYRSASQLAYTPTGTTTVKVYRDFDDSTPEVTFDLDYIANNEEIIKGLPWAQRRSIGIEFSNNTINEQILISGWTFELMPYRNQIRR